MPGPITTSVRCVRRSCFHAAALAAVFLTLGGPAARASELYYNDNTAWAVSTNNYQVLVKGTPGLYPSSNLMTVQYSAWKPGGPYNCTVEIYLYDQTGGYYTYVASHRAPFYEQNFYAVFPVTPGHSYSVWMYIQDPQPRASWTYYTRIWQIFDGYVPSGTRIN